MQNYSLTLHTYVIPVIVNNIGDRMDVHQTRHLERSVSEVERSQGHIHMRFFSAEQADQNDKKHIAILQ